MPPKPKDQLPKIPQLSPEEALVAAVPKDAFKAMFYLFAGKPDSKVKLFRRKIIVRFEDIRDLNRKVYDKLKLHQIDQCVASAVVKFEKEEILEFGTWAEFEGFDWKVPYVTQEITVRWDFMVKLPSYTAPQRNTLTVRLSASPSPKDMFQIMMSQDPDDPDVDGKLGLCVARVDFISHRLADELIDVVEEWNNALRQPESACTWFCSLERVDEWIARAVHYSVPLFFTALSVAALGYWISSESVAITSPVLVLFGRWLLVSILGLYCAIRFSHSLAARCYRAVNEYGAFIPFALTRGDENEADKVRGRNRTHISRFLLSAGFALILNIVAGVLTWWMLPKNG